LSDIKGGTLSDLLRPYGDKQRIFDKRYIEMALIWAQNSYCQRRKVGALIVKGRMIISDGYNGTPSGFENVCEDENNLTKPYVLHAEANAITRWQNRIIRVRTRHFMFTTSPCMECSKLIIQSESGGLCFAINTKTPTDWIFSGVPELRLYII
jgi:dCMP deaminase